MNTLGITLLWCALQVSVVGIICLVLRRCVQSAASTITLVGFVVCCGLVIVSFLPLPSWFEITRAVAQAPTNNNAQSALSTASNPSPNSIDSSNHVRTAAEVLSSDESAWSWLNWESLGKAAQPAALDAKTPARSWPAYVAIACLTAMVLGFVQLMGGIWALATVRRRSEALRDRNLTELLDILRAEMSLRRCPDLLECAELTTAATIGWRKPAILLPSMWRTWSDEQRRAVLAHELAHIRRRDYLASVLAQMGLALQFYHPVMHWLANRLRLEQELAADAVAAELVGGRQPYMYSLCELAIQQSDKTLGWPARNFLPTRGALMRRIDMLRSSKESTPRRLNVVRYVAVGVLVVTGFVLVGFRGPSGTSVVSQLMAQEAKPTPSASDNAQFDGSLIPEDAVVVVSARPAALLSNKALDSAVAELTKQLEAQLQVNVRDVDQLIFVVHHLIPPAAGPVQSAAPGAIIIRAKTPETLKKLAEHAVPNAKKVVAGKYELYRSENAAWPHAYLFIDERTLVLDHPSTIASFLVGRSQPSKLISGESWKSVAAGELAIAVDSAWLRDMLEGQQPGMRIGGAAQLAIFSPLWKDTDSVVAGLVAGESSKLTVLLQSSQEEQAERVRATVDAALTLSRNGLQQARGQIRGAPVEQQLIMNAAFSLTDSMLKSAKVTRDGLRVKLEATAPLGEATMLGLIAPALSAQRIAAGRMQDANNLKQIGLAMHNYADTYKHFPAPVIMGPDGKTPHSWRVAILPFIEQDALYRMYKFDEPWDSDNNRRVLERMPAIYRSPADRNGKSTNAAYFALVGPDTIFPDNGKGTGFQDILDGTSNTIMVVEAQREIPWTKPEDISINFKEELPKFGGWNNEGFNVLFGDGSVKFLANGIDKDLLHDLITKAGGEAIQNLDPAPGPGPRPTPPPALRRQ